MFPYLSFLSFCLAVFSIIIAIIIEWKGKKKSAKKWLYASLFMALFSTLLNEYVASHISKIAKMESEGKNKTITGLENKIGEINVLNDSLRSQLDSTKLNLNIANTKIIKLEKITAPVPLPIRLRNLLNDISPEILIKLKKGVSAFEAKTTASNNDALRKIANEPNAGKYIKIHPLPPNGMIQSWGSGGTVSYFVYFELNKDLLNAN